MTKFSDFCPFSTKNGVFHKNQCFYLIFANYWQFFEQNKARQFFRIYFLRKYISPWLAALAPNLFPFIVKFLFSNSLREMDPIIADANWGLL
jgi:hypothetical protein